MQYPLLLLIFIYFYFNSTSFAQKILPENSFLFSDKEVARIDITINPDSLSKILEGDFSSDHEYPADFRMTRGTIIKTVENVGFRLRGNTSRNSKKNVLISGNGSKNSKLSAPFIIHNLLFERNLPCQSVPKFTSRTYLSTSGKK